MKKIITAVAVLLLTTFSAKALPELGMFSITAGAAANTSVYGASAKTDNYDETDSTIIETDKQSGVFADTHSSQFLELGIGKYVSLGYEMGEGVSTPQNVSNEGNKNGSEQTTSVTFQDLNTTYLKINIPGGAYLKYGTVETDLDVKTSRSSYKDVSISGTTIGAGYQRHFGDTGFGIRVEGSYLEFDNAATQDVATAVITDNGKNVISATNLEGASAKLALTYTFGRNN
jgi:hypothetical protein